MKNTGVKKVCIVAFAFGKPGTILSNQIITKIVSGKARELNAPVFTQLDVPIKPGIQVEYIKEKPGKPPSTLRIAQEAIRWAKKNQFTEIRIVAAKPHLWRATRDIQRAAGKNKVPIEIHVCNKEIEEYPAESWFCSDSQQRRTRSRKAWNKREQILRLTPFLFYKLITRLIN